MLHFYFFLDSKSKRDHFLLLVVIVRIPQLYGQYLLKSCQTAVRGGGACCKQTISFALITGGKVAQLCGGPGRSSGRPAERNLNWCGSNVASLVF